MSFLPNTYHEDIEPILVKFNKVFQEHMYEDLLRLTPFQYQLSDETFNISNNLEYDFDLVTQQQTQSTPLQQSLLSGFIGFWEPTKSSVREREKGNEDEENNKSCNII